MVVRCRMRSSFSNDLVSGMHCSRSFSAAKRKEISLHSNCVQDCSPEERERILAAIAAAEARLRVNMMNMCGAYSACNLTLFNNVIT